MGCLTSRIKNVDSISSPFGSSYRTRLWPYIFSSRPSAVTGGVPSPPYASNLTSDANNGGATWRNDP
eukprot:14676092-Heterocapsa_arctica.AAC.1